MSAQAFGCLQRNGIGKELTTFGVDIQAAIPFLDGETPLP